MSRVCTVCASPGCADIDRALIDGYPSKRQIAAQNGVSENSVRRHQKAGHVSQAMVVAGDVADVAAADGLVAALMELRADAERFCAQAGRDKDYKSALHGVRERLRLIQVAAELDGTYRDRRQDTRVSELEQELADRKAEAEGATAETFDWLDRGEQSALSEVGAVYQYLVRLAAQRREAGDITIGAMDFGRDYYNQPHRQGSDPWLKVGKGEDARPYFCQLLRAAKGR